MIETREDLPQKKKKCTQVQNDVQLNDVVQQLDHLNKTFSKIKKYQKLMTKWTPIKKIEGTAQ